MRYAGANAPYKLSFFPFPFSPNKYLWHFLAKRYMTDEYSASTEDNIIELSAQFLSGSEKKQLQLISQLVNAGEPGVKVLEEFLLSNQSLPSNIVMGKAYQALYQLESPKTQEFLQNKFPQGVLPLKSERNIDYQPIQELLAKQDFQGADTVTREKMCELAGEGAMKRKWLYFTEVEQFPITDFQTINQLWWIYSEGKFGFGVQRKIWLSVGKDFTKLWPKIAWKNGNNWTKYPDEFIWNLNAPPGHLPLLNQLRGARVITSIFSHPVWSCD